MAPEQKTAPEGKRTIVELANGTQIQVMPGDPIPVDAVKTVGSEPLGPVEERVEVTNEEGVTSTAVRTTEVASPKRKSTPRKGGSSKKKG